MEIIESFEKWKNFLGNNVLIAKGVGVSEERIIEIANRIGKMLTKTVDPENREQRLLKELWDVGDEEDRKVLTKLIVRMVEEEHD